jgi:hypothetical protein
MSGALSTPCAPKAISAGAQREAGNGRPEPEHAPSIDPAAFRCHLPRLLDKTLHPVERAVQGPSSRSEIQTFLGASAASAAGP